MDKVALLTEILNRNGLARNDATERMQECQGRVSEVMADCRKSAARLEDARHADNEIASKLQSVGELLRDSSNKPQFLFDEQSVAATAYRKSQERLKQAIFSDDECKERLTLAERNLERARAEVDRLATACSDAQKEIAQYRN